MESFKTGDKVKIITYGALFWQFKNMPQPYHKLPVVFESEEVQWCDMLPDIVGKIGIIESVINTQNIPKYSISGIPEKHAWYDHKQLELIK